MAAPGVVDRHGYVAPYCHGGHVMCPCVSPMTAILYVDLEHDCEWIFWRCDSDSLHVTRMIPRPVQMTRG